MQKDRTEYLKEYYKKNKLRIKERNTAFYIDKKEILLKRSRTYYSNNKEKYQKIRDSNREKYKEYYKEYYVKEKRNSQYKKRYDLSLDDYNSLFEKQNGKCAGCGMHQTELKKGLCVDHCHNTGKVRGLLCNHCNSSIGFARDNTEVLKNLIKYLEQNS